jgi:hypothetical protein
MSLAGEFVVVAQGQSHQSIFYSRNMCVKCFLSGGPCHLYREAEGRVRVSPQGDNIVMSPEFKSARNS